MIVDEDQDGSFHFHMDPEPGQLGGVCMGKPENSNSLDIDGSVDQPASAASSFPENDVFGFEVSSPSPTPDNNPLRTTSLPSSNGTQNSLHLDASPPFPRPLSGAVSMGTTPPNNHPLLSPKTKRNLMAPVGSIGAVSMGTTPPDALFFHKMKSNRGAGNTNPTRGVPAICHDWPCDPVPASVTPHMNQNGFQWQSRDVIERPQVCHSSIKKEPTHPADLPPNGTNKTSPNREHFVAGFDPPARTDTGPSSGSKPPRPNGDSPLRDRATNKPPVHSAGKSSSNGRTPSPGRNQTPLASSLVSRVSQTAANMWGSALDLVAMAPSGASSPRSGQVSDDETGRPIPKKSNLKEEMDAKAQVGNMRSPSWSGLNPVASLRVPSASDLVAFMWTEAPNSSSTAKAGLSPLSTLRHSRRHKPPAWSGLRHDPQKKEAKPEKSVAGKAMGSLLHSVKGLRKNTFGSTPNLKDLDTSKSQSATSRVYNHKDTFFDNYIMTTSLGTGGYAVVRRCIHKTTGQEYAVKIMQLSTKSDDEGQRPRASGSCSDDEADEEEEENGDKSMTIREIANELSLMCKLDHPNIVKIHEFFIHAGQAFVVMQLLQGPELMDALIEVGQKAGKEDGEVGAYTEADARCVMASLMDAISYMHQMGITHRDLKLENCVLATPGDLSSAVIVDFGLAKAARAREKMEETCGTPWYSSPELLLGDPYTQAVDLWSLGVAMYVLLTGDFPFDHEDEDELCDLIIEGELNMEGPKWESISPQAKDLIRGLLEVNPSKRVTAVEAIEHPWFTGEIEVHAAASLLHHAHMRLTRLVESAPGRLPIVTFEPGQWLAREGQRGRDVYMILEGEAEVVRARGAIEEYSPPANSDPALYQDYVKVRTLRKGNFAGQLAQQLVESIHRKSLERGRTMGSGDVHKVLMEAVSASAEGNGGPPPPAALLSALQTARPTCIDIPKDETLPGSQASTVAPSPTSVVSMASTPSEMSWVDVPPHMPPSPFSDASQTASVPESPKGWMNQAIKGLGVVSTLIRARRTWVGHRRTASVRAITEVRALVLNRDDMQWAVEHDYRLSHELQEAMRKQRKKLRAKVREAKKAATAKAAAELESGMAAQGDEQ